MNSLASAYLCRAATPWDPGTGPQSSAEAMARNPVEQTDGFITEARSETWAQNVQQVL